VENLNIAGGALTTGNNLTNIISGNKYPVALCTGAQLEMYHLLVVRGATRDHTGGQEWPSYSVKSVMTAWMAKWPAFSGGVSVMIY